MTEEQMVFDDLELRQVPVRIQGKDYLLKEANGEAARRFRNAIIKSAKFNAEGKAERLEGVADAELILVNACLVDSSGRQTPIQVLAGWPNRVIKALFNRAKDISDLSEVDNSEEGLFKRKDQLSHELKDVNERLAKMAEARDQGKETDPIGLSPDSTPDGSVSPAT